MVCIKTTNVNNKEITRYEHPLIQLLIKVINGNVNVNSTISNFVKLILSTAIGELVIHRDEKNELVLADKFGHTFHIFDGHCYMRTYPKGEKLTTDLLRSLAKWYTKNEEWRNLEKLSAFMQLDSAQRRANGFPLYGDLWELENDGIALYEYDTTHIGDMSDEEMLLVGTLINFF